MNTPKQKKQCCFCQNNIKEIDYKNLEDVKRFANSYGQILPRRRTGTCAKHQRKYATAVKRARIMALTLFTTK